jgi:hypothetical protein
MLVLRDPIRVLGEGFRFREEARRLEIENLASCGRFCI